MSDKEEMPSSSLAQPLASTSAEAESEANVKTLRELAEIAAIKAGKLVEDEESEKESKELKEPKWNKRVAMRALKTKRVKEVDPPVDDDKKDARPPHVKRRRYLPPVQLRKNYRIAVVAKKKSTSDDDDVPQPRCDTDNAPENVQVEELAPEPVVEELEEEEEEQQQQGAEEEDTFEEAPINLPINFVPFDMDVFNNRLERWSSERGLELFEYDYVNSRNNTTICCYKIVNDPEELGLLHVALYNLYHTPYEGALFYARIEYAVELYPNDAPFVTMVTPTGLYAENVPFRPVVRSLGAHRWTISNVLCHLIAEMISFSTSGGLGEGQTYVAAYPNSMVENLTNPDFCRFFPVISDLYRKRLVEETQFKLAEEQRMRDQAEDEASASSGSERFGQVVMGVLSLGVFAAVQYCLYSFAANNGYFLESWMDYFWS